MEFDPNVAFGSTHVALYAMENQASRPAAATPPRSACLVAPARASVQHLPVAGPSTRGAMNSLVESRSMGYRELPPEILQLVANYTPFDDIGSLSGVDKGTYHALQEWRLSWLCRQRAEHVAALDLPSVQQLLTQLEDIRAKPMLRIQPLQALWRRAMKDLPDAQHPAAFQQIFEAAGRVPKHGLPLQKDMIISICDFPYWQQPNLYQIAYADAERRSLEQGSTWAALLSLRRHCSFSPKPVSDFLARLPTLNVEDQFDLLMELTGQISDFRSRKTIVEFYEALFQGVQRLPESYRGAPIGALAKNMRLLPKAKRSVHYANLWRLTLSLPDHQLGSALEYLPSALATLPLAQHTHELSLLEPVIQRVLPEQRAQAAFGLLYGTPHLKQGWQRALHLLDNGSEADALHMFSKLESLSMRTQLPEQQWEEVKTEVRAFVERNRFSQETRAALLAYIAG
jgi:hypothetical protein